jgi:peptide/nickel transport system substrate-binding protein
MTIFRSLRTLALSVAAGMVIAFSGAGAATAADARTTVTVAVTNDFSSWNPYADSTAVIYGIWCEIYGCLATYDFDKGDYVGMLAESWDVDKKDHNIWTFHLRHGLKRHGDGKELTAEDVVHSVNRIKTDKRTAQTFTVRPIKSVSAVDKYTVRIVTQKPTADLMLFLSDEVCITGKDLYDKYGAKADQDHPLGWGPYMLKDVVIGQRMVLEKNPNWPGIKTSNPDRLIYRRIKEDEARVTALLNGEIQVAQLIPAHLMKRVEDAQGAGIRSVPSVEDMFLGMNEKFKPWDNKLARQAVAYAINRPLIIKTVLHGQASILHGPAGKGQYAYDPDIEPKYHYDPKKARELLQKAGLIGTHVDLNTTVDRYMYDRQSVEAMVPMLNAVGFKVTLHTPEYATEFAMVKKGQVPFYYHGRGSLLDPSVGLSQYFETGGSPRIRYSNPEFDKALQASRAEFDPAKRKKLLQKVYSIIQEDVPAFFLWRINVIYGVSNKVDYTPRPNHRIYGTDMTMK